MLRTRIIATTASVLVVSAVFASMMTFINRAETFVEPFRLEPGETAPITLRIPWTRVHHVGADGQSHVDSDAPIVGIGTVVPAGELGDLVRAYEEDRRPPTLANMMGLWFVYFLIAAMLTTYLRGLSPGRGALLR